MTVYKRLNGKFNIDDNTTIYDLLDKVYPEVIENYYGILFTNFNMNIDLNESLNMKMEGSYVTKDLELVPFLFELKPKYRNTFIGDAIPPYRFSEDFVEEAEKTMTNRFFYMKNKYGYDCFDEFDATKPEFVFDGKGSFICLSKESYYFWTKFFQSKANMMKKEVDEQKSIQHIKIIEMFKKDKDLYQTRFNKDTVADATFLNGLLIRSKFEYVKMFNMDFYVKEVGKDKRIYINHLYIIAESYGKWDILSVLQSKHGKGQLPSVLAYANYLTNYLNFHNYAEKEKFISNYRKVFRG